MSSHSESSKGDIILKPKNVVVQNKGSQLKIIYKNITSASFWLTGILLLIPIYFAWANVSSYFKIDDINQANYEERLIEQKSKLQAEHLAQEETYRTTIQKEYSTIDREIFSKEMELKTEELKQKIGNGEKKTDNRSKIQQELKQLEKRKTTLKAQLDSLQKAGPIDSLSNAELDNQLQEWKASTQPYIQATTDELMSYVIVPLGILALSLLLFFYLYKNFRGNDVLLVDKQQQLIKKRKDNRYAKTKEISTANIKQFFCKSRVSGGESSRTYYSVWYIDQQGDAHELLDSMSNSEDAIYIEQQLEHFLGIQHQNVRGSIG